MPDSDILYKSITEIQKNLVNKKISSVELTKLALKRIDETNNKTNAFLHVAHDFAINEAKKTDAKISKGNDIGLLGGIPTSIKDLESVKGMPHTNGSWFYKNNIADENI